MHARDALSYMVFLRTLSADTPRYDTDSMLETWIQRQSQSSSASEIAHSSLVNNVTSDPISVALPAFLLRVITDSFLEDFREHTLESLELPSLHVLRQLKLGLPAGMGSAAATSPGGPASLRSRKGLTFQQASHREQAGSEGTMF